MVIPPKYLTGNSLHIAYSKSKNVRVSISIKCYFRIQWCMCVKFAPKVVYDSYLIGGSQTLLHLPKLGSKDRNYLANLHDVKIITIPILAEMKGYTLREFSMHLDQEESSFIFSQELPCT